MICTAFEQGVVMFPAQCEYPVLAQGDMSDFHLSDRMRSFQVLRTVYMRCLGHR